MRYAKAGRRAYALSLCGVLAAAIGARPQHRDAAYLHEQRVAAADSIKILLFYDMEGATEITNGAMFDVRKPEEFARGRESLIDDVNMVVAGLFDGRATAVHIFNAHGSGGDTLVPRRRLDRRVRILQRRGPRDAYDPTNSLVDSAYDAVVTVAMHDKPLSGGFSPHTMGVGITPIINGSGLTETELIGYAYGLAGIPVIFVSGDDQLQRSLERTMPWIEYVVVKQVSQDTVAPLQANRARADLRQGAARAVTKLRIQGRVRPMRLAAPIQAGLLPTFPQWLPPTMGDVPGLTTRGDTVVFVATDYREAYRGISLLVLLASGGRDGYVLDLVRATADGQRAIRTALDTLAAQTHAFELGTWRPPSQYR